VVEGAAVTELFSAPLALWWLVALPIAWWLAAWWQRVDHRSLERFAGQRHRALGAHTTRAAARRRLARRGLSVLGLGCAVVALAQPRWGAPQGEFEPEPLDLLVCLDVSRSMLARDVAGSAGPTSRLDRAHLELEALAQRVEGDRLGLLVFAGEAVLACPLTTDTVSFASLAKAADPLAVALGGTDLAAALDLASSTLDRHGSGRGIVLLMTDGEDHGATGQLAAQRLAQRGHVVHCVGLGSARGAMIPLGNGAFVRDREGRDVVTALDPTTLEAIARAGGGTCTTVDDTALDRSDTGTAAPQTLVDLYDRHVATLRRQALQSERLARRPNRFQWPLLVAFCLWILALVLPTPPAFLSKPAP